MIDDEDVHEFSEPGTELATLMENHAIAVSQLLSYRLRNGHKLPEKVIIQAEVEIIEQDAVTGLLRCGFSDVKFFEDIRKEVLQ